ncbi:hypothetical protein [Marinifilum sp.]|uniref:hypothetical protein n=1 Tax=Marinifilum sp. TaxID=2033137 RepID=UPI003BACB8DD
MPAIQDQLICGQYGASTQSITVSTSGNYSVFVDANGCSATDDVNVTVHPNPTVDLGMDQETCAGGSITLDAGNTGSTYLWNTGASTQSIAVSTSGNYSVVVTDANGCSATDDVNVTVHPNPTVDLGMDQETCAGGSITLDAGNTGSTYLWNTGASTQSITVSTSGNYSVFVTDANGCSATDDVNVTVHPNPTVDLINGSANLCRRQYHFGCRQYRINLPLEYRIQHTKHYSFNFRQLFSGCNRCEWLFGNR